MGERPTGLPKEEDRMDQDLEFQMSPGWGTDSQEEAPPLQSDLDSTSRSAFG